LPRPAATWPAATASCSEARRPSDRPDGAPDAWRGFASARAGRPARWPGWVIVPVSITAPSPRATAAGP
jgi:hypothetical protein